LHYDVNIANTVQDNTHNVSGLRGMRLREGCERRMLGGGGWRVTCESGSGRGEERVVRRGAGWGFGRASWRDGEGKSTTAAATKTKKNARRGR
jgi:hypothetical protein